MYWNCYEIRWMFTGYSFNYSGHLFKEKCRVPGMRDSQAVTALDRSNLQSQDLPKQDESPLAFCMASAVIYETAILRGAEQSQDTHLSLTPSTFLPLVAWTCDVQRSSSHAPRHETAPVCPDFATLLQAIVIRVKYRSIRKKSEGTPNPPPRYPQNFIPTATAHGRPFSSWAVAQVLWYISKNERSYQHPKRQTRGAHATPRSPQIEGDKSEVDAEIPGRDTH
ncbi:hypothetical protein DFH09DRAFT_1288701 [Mycena vulgaris]|nr:hypothetical protein DFH09DRAFT_1288701 [Mycena vulgaris]